MRMLVAVVLNFVFAFVILTFGLATIGAVIRQDWAAAIWPGVITFAAGAISLPFSIRAIWIAESKKYEREKAEASADPLGHVRQLPRRPLP